MSSIADFKLEGDVASDAMSPLSTLGLDDVSASELAGIAEASSGLPYDHYISFSKLQATPMLRVLDCLSKLAAALSGKNVLISANEKLITVKYDNAAYQFVFRIPNSSGKTLSPFAIPISTLKALFGNVMAHLVLVEQQSSFGDQPAGLYAHFSGNLVFVATQPFDEAMYKFAYDKMTDQLDGSYIRTHLRSFTSLLAFSERTLERHLICQGGMSYLNIGSILGRMKSFFGNHDCIISRYLVDCIATLAEFDGTSVSGFFADDHASLKFGDSCYLRFAYTSGEAVSRFMSPLFRNSFSYDTSIRIDDTPFCQLLTVIGSLDYFTDTIKVSFATNDFTVVAHKKDGSDATYKFQYKEGTSPSGTIVVSIPVLLGVLSKASDVTKYSCASSSLVVDLGDCTYCVRSVLMA